MKNAPGRLLSWMMPSVVLQSISLHCRMYVSVRCCCSHSQWFLVIDCCFRTLLMSSSNVCPLRVTIVDPAPFFPSVILHGTSPLECADSARASAASFPSFPLWPLTHLTSIRDPYCMYASCITSHHAAYVVRVFCRNVACVPFLTSTLNCCTTALLSM